MVAVVATKAVVAITAAEIHPLFHKQLTGEYSIRNHPLIELHGKVQDLLRPHDDLVVTYQHIPREENHIADSLANQAIATRVNVTTCNWTNINRLMSVDR